MKKIIYTMICLSTIMTSCKEVEFVSTNYDIHTYSGVSHNIKMNVKLHKVGNRVYKTNSLGTRVFKKKYFEFNEDSVVQRDKVARTIYYK